MSETKTPKTQAMELLETQAMELLEDEDLATLEGRIGAVNLFEAANMGRQEIRHSAFLRWVLDPASAHGLGDVPLHRLLARLFMTNEGGDFADFVVSDLGDAVVRTEAQAQGKSRMDILVTSESRRLVLCIENKTGSQLHDLQLEAYRGYLEREYDGWTRLYVLLAPDDFVPEEKQLDKNGNWMRLNYSDIAEVLNGLLPSANEKTGLLIGDYVDLLKREGLMEDAQLDRLTTNLYKRYNQVFDLVSAYRNDSDEKNEKTGLAAGLYRMHGPALNLVNERCTGQNGVEGRLRDIYLKVLDDMKQKGLLSSCAPLDSTRKYLFFHTPGMDAYLRESGEKGTWRDGRTYNFWIYPSLLKPTVKLELGAWQQTDEVIERQEQLRKAASKGSLTSKATKEITRQTKYRIIASIPTGIDMSGDAATIADIDENNVKTKLRDAIDRMLDNERWLLDTVND